MSHSMFDSPNYLPLFTQASCLITKNKSIKAMEKVHLTKAELALLDALIADMQEGDNEPTLAAGSAGNLSFIGGITRVARKAFNITVKVTPVAARVVGQALGGAASGSETSKQMSALLGSDGGTLSVDQLIELRKAAQ